MLLTLAAGAVAYRERAFAVVAALMGAARPRARRRLVVVDVQEGFRPYASFGVARACAKLVRARASSRCPRIVSEQYPKGLGHTAPEVGLEDEPAIEKTVFSAARAEGFDLGGRDQAIVCGIETHVCVSQTVHDLLDAGRRGARARRRRRLAPRARLRARPRAPGARRARS